MTDDVGRVVAVKSGGPNWTVEKVIHSCIRTGGETAYMCVRAECDGRAWRMRRKLFRAKVLRYVDKEEA